LTITLDDETARWTRVEAAKRDTSMSRLVGELLREHMQRGDDYARAHASYISRNASALTTNGESYPSRDQVHER